MNCDTIWIAEPKKLKLQTAPVSSRLLPLSCQIQQILNAKRTDPIADVSNLENEMDKVVYLTKAIELKPDYVEAYCNRGMAWLDLGVWDKAKSDLTIAKTVGADIVTEFHREYQSVSKFEKKNGVKLPEDIAAMITPQ